MVDKTVYQYRGGRLSLLSTLLTSSSTIPLKVLSSEINRVETRLKQSVLLSYSVGKFSFWILKWHHHEKSIKPVSQNRANDGLHTFNLEWPWITSYELKAMIDELQYQLQATSYELWRTSYELQAKKTCTYKIPPAPADDSTVRYWTVVWLYGAELSLICLFSFNVKRHSYETCILHTF